MTCFSASNLSGNFIGKLYIVLPVSAIMTCFSASNLSGRFIGKLFIVLNICLKIVSEYDQEIPQSQTADNPVAFKPNGISHLYQMEHSISVLRDIWWYFHLYSNFNRTFYKQTVETLIRRHVLWRLIWVSTVCICPTKRTLGLNRITMSYGTY